MKRIITLASVAAFLVVLPASHLLMGDGPRPNKVTICHLTPPANSGNADGTGVVIEVNRHSRNGHIQHGDCTRFRVGRDGSCRCGR